MILLCLAQGSFPVLCSHVGKTDSRVVFELSPFVVDIDSTILCHSQDRILGGLHDLLHVFNTSLINDDFTFPCRVNDQHTLQNQL